MAARILLGSRDCHCVHGSIEAQDPLCMPARRGRAFIGHFGLLCFGLCVWPAEVYCRARKHVWTDPGSKKKPGTDQRLPRTHVETNSNKKQNLWTKSDVEQSLECSSPGSHPLPSRPPLHSAAAGPGWCHPKPGIQARYFRDQSCRVTAGILRQKPFTQQGD